MSKKQSGASPGEELEPQAGERRGWFGRLRAQPGFRTASIAFVLTVVLGIGSTAAYAYWSQNNTVTQTVTTVRQPLPVLKGAAKCDWNGPVLWSNVIIIQPKLSASDKLPADAAIVMIIDDKKGRTYYSLNTTEPIKLVDVPGLRDRVRGDGGSDLLIGMTTAYLKAPASTAEIAPLDVNMILDPPSQPAGAAKAVYRLSYTCN